MCLKHQFLALLRISFSYGCDNLPVRFYLFFGIMYMQHIPEVSVHAVAKMLEIHESVKSLLHQTGCPSFSAAQSVELESSRRSCRFSEILPPFPRPGGRHLIYICFCRISDYNVLYSLYFQNLFSLRMLPSWNSVPDSCWLAIVCQLYAFFLRNLTQKASLSLIGIDNASAFKNMEGFSQHISADTEFFGQTPVPEAVFLPASSDSCR